MQKGQTPMKLLLYLTWREIRSRPWRLLPFSLIASALIFTSVAQVTFQESANSDSAIEYMMTPTYMILLSAFAIIGFVAAKSFFSIFSDSLMHEYSVLRALGMKKRMIRRMCILLGGLCILTGAVIGVPAAIGFIYVFVSVCTSGDMTVTGYVPLGYSIPAANIGIVLVIMFTSMMLGVCAGFGRDGEIAAMLKRQDSMNEAECGKGVLPEEGDLADYGKLFVRRSLRRCAKYNLITAFMLILPMIYLLGASTFGIDRSTHDFEMSAKYNYSSYRFTEITNEMITEIDSMDGVLNASGNVTLKKGYGEGIFNILIYAEDGADTSALRNSLKSYSDSNELEFEDTAVIRAESNKISLLYQWFFITDSVIMFSVACAVSFAMTKSRLTVRRRELMLLRSLGARADDISKAVTPETVADYAFGAFISIAFGALGFCAMMADGESTADILSVIILCCLFLIATIFVQIRASKKMTRDILASSDNRI